MKVVIVFHVHLDYPKIAYKIDLYLFASCGFAHSPNQLMLLAIASSRRPYVYLTGPSSISFYTDPTFAPTQPSITPSPR